jgi:hypothetical protein
MGYDGNQYLGIFRICQEEFHRSKPQQMMDGYYGIDGMQGDGNIMGMTQVKCAN